MYFIFSSNEVASIIAASYIASGAGGTIGMSIPYWTFLILTVGISAYDVFAVYGEHLSTLTKGEALSLKGLTVEVGDLVIGIGDLFFYSLAISAILWDLGELSAAATIAIIAGYTLNPTASSKKENGARPSDTADRRHHLYILGENCSRREFSICVFPYVFSKILLITVLGKSEGWA